MTAQTSFILPDLVSHCSYPLRMNRNYEGVARTSEKWLLEAANHNDKRRNAFMGLKAGELTASCYPEADIFHLRVCVDFMNYLFSLDDWLDEFDVEGIHGMRTCCLSAMRDPIGFNTDKMVGKMTKSFFARFVYTAGTGCRERFIHSMDLFFKAVSQQASDRAQGVTPDLESYISMRRDTSGCKPCFQMIEFAGGFDLPREVAEHPVIQSLEEATNDLVTWSNDFFSYNVEQARSDTHNMVCVIMSEQAVGLQEAVDMIGEHCKISIERFEADRQFVPSWGQSIDQDVALYIDGLQNWIVGSLHWSFDTERYFGKFGHLIKMHRVVELLSKKSAAMN